MGTSIAVQSSMLRAMHGFVALLCVAASSGLMLTPHVALRTQMTAAWTSPRRQAPLTMSQRVTAWNVMDVVSAYFAKSSGKEKMPPTLAEIEEYCRDPESTGCSVEMMDILMAEAAKLKEASPHSKEIRWSAEIDDAVVKTE